MQEILALVDRLSSRVEALRPLGQASGPPPAESAGARREKVLLTLRLKVLPELRTEGSLPIFVGVEGGTNTGKSTVFNSLAGHILSPSVVQGSATKHPLVFAHEAWRPALLDPETFPDLELCELTDPKDLLLDESATERVYLRFHAREEWRDWAFIDSPDVDSILDSNSRAARIVTALSDVVVFVTTAEKYRDRILVEHLKRVVDSKATVIIVFNRLDEEIVFNTLLDDLRGAVPFATGAVKALHTPRVLGSVPEERLSPLLLPEIARHLGGAGTRSAKEALLRRTIRETLESVEELHRSYSLEADLKKLFRRAARDALDASRASYAATFSLALPEETLAIRRVLRAMELGTWIRLDRDVERSSRSLASVALVLARIASVVRTFLLQLTPRSEGAVEDSERDIEEYRAARDETDQQRVAYLALEARQHLETFFRMREGSSALARQVLADHFTPENARTFLGRVREVHRRELDARRDRAEDVLERVDSRLLARPGRRRALGIGAIALKVAAGLGLAWLLPPDSGWIAGLFDVLSWVEFAAGYLLGAYVEALVVAFALRRRGRFREARIDALDHSIRGAVIDPLARNLDDLLAEDELHRLQELVEQVRKRLETPAVADAVKT